MGKFTWLEIIEITINMLFCIAILTASYFFLIMMIEIQNVMVGAIV